MNKKVFMTGVSSGIGLSLAQEYLASGCEVWGLSRKSPDQLVKSYGSRFRFVSVDLQDLEGLQNHLSSLLKDCAGSLDLVVLNAGVLGSLGSLAQTKLTDLKKTTDINLWSNKIILDYLLNEQIAVKQVVAISTGAATVARPGWNGYSISKAALNMMIGIYAAEHSSTHFSSIAPGVIDTQMQEQIYSLPRGKGFEAFDRLIQLRDSGQMKKPHQVAPDLVRFFDTVLNNPSGSFLSFR
jgi:benzil reductase ((S)-benzoin forming)